MMNFITMRAINLTKYLISQGMDPMEACYISINKYIHNPKLDIKKLIKTIKKSIKQEFYYEEEEI